MFYKVKLCFKEYDFKDHLYLPAHYQGRGHGLENPRKDYGTGVSRIPDWVQYEKVQNK